jgi:hypothetical protein
VHQVGHFHCTDFKPFMTFINVDLPTATTDLSSVVPRGGGGVGVGRGGGAPLPPPPNPPSVRHCKGSIFGEYLCTTEPLISTAIDTWRVLVVVFKDVTTFTLLVVFCRCSLMQIIDLPLNFLNLHFWRITMTSERSTVAPYFCLQQRILIYVQLLQWKPEKPRVKRNMAGSGISPAFSKTNLAERYFYPSPFARATKYAQPHVQNIRLNLDSVWHRPVLPPTSIPLRRLPLDEKVSRKWARRSSVP